MRTESIVSAVFALGTAASAWFGWPFALTAGCAIVSAACVILLKALAKKKTSDAKADDEMDLDFEIN